MATMPQRVMRRARAVAHHLAVGIYHSEPSLSWRWSAVCVAGSYVAHAKVQVGLYKLALDSATLSSSAAVNP